MKSKDKELLNAKSASCKLNKDLEHLNTNLKLNMLSIKKEVESVQSNHHFSIASAVETAKVKEMAKVNERNLLQTEMKQIATMNVSPTGVFSASCLLFFFTHRICKKHIQARERVSEESNESFNHVMDKQEDDPVGFDADYRRLSESCQCTDTG